MKNITNKNTKAEMIEAYNEAIERIKELEKQKNNPQAVALKKEEKRVVESADKLIGLSILSSDITSKYEDLKKAITLKETELKELFEIEKEANTLVALLNLYKDKEVELEESFKVKRLKLLQEFEDKKEEVDRDIDKLSKEKAETLKNLQNQEAELKAQLKKQREREEEEYKYELDRKKIKANNEWEEEKAKREKELADKEAVVSEREKVVEDKNNEIEELKAKVDEIPTLLEKAKVEGATEKEKELGREYGYKKSLAEKEHQYEVKSLVEKNERLEADLRRAISEKDVLQEKLDKAYAELRELATQTVKSSGGVKILSAEKEK